MLLRLNKKDCRFCGQRLTNLDKRDKDTTSTPQTPHSVKPPCVPSHERSKITLLNSRQTDDSLPVSTLVTPGINYDSDSSRVHEVRVKVSLDLFVT